MTSVANEPERRIVDPVLSGLGRTVRRLRTERGLSLRELSSRTGLAKRTLTDLEAGRGNPTVETLWALATFLDTTLGELFLESSPSRVTVLRAEARPAVPPSFAGACRLSGRFESHGDVEVYEAEVALSGLDDHPVAAPHSTGVHELVVVLEGMLETGPVDQSTVLRAGDSSFFAADVPHIYRPVDGDARCLIVLAYPAAQGHASPSSLLRDHP